MNLKDKVAVITGAAQGIGKKTAKLFAEKGAVVIVADYNEKAAKITENEINSSGGKAEFIKVDVSDKKSSEELINSTIEKHGKIDILVNNAGVTSDQFLTKMDESDWDKVLSVNLKGVFNCSQPAAKFMMEAGKGVILNASSVVGLYGNIGQTNYAASKFGVIGLTKTWAKELGPKGVRVNAVAPGFVNTEMIEKVPDKVLEKITKKVPLRRLGKVEDIANAYLYLASEQASYVNGTVLSVDGGLVLG